MNKASRRAGKHIADTASVYLTNLIHRLDRATHVVSQQVEAGDLRAANTFANLVKSSADIIAVVYPKSLPDVANNAPGGDLLMIAARMGLAVPQPLLGDGQAQTE